MSDLDKTEVRRVSEADYDDVMSIRSTLYGGYDYLPFSYRSLMTHSHNEGYAAVINGKFVAFCFVSKVDGGETAVSRASRVNKQYEGFGVYKALTLFIEKHLFSDGTVLNGAVVYSERNPKMVIATSRGEYTLLMKRTVIVYKVDCEKMTVLSQGTHPTKHTQILNAVDLETAFKSSKVCSTLFPEERIVCNKVPYRLKESNIPLIISEVSLIVGTTDPECSLITCGVYYRSESGHTYSLEVYGNCDFIKEHLVLHFQHALQCCHKEVVIHFFCNENEASKIGIEMKEMKFRNVDIQFPTVFVVEKKIK
ncbi:histidine N-acetyltransferase-like [Mytilus californianus]|uniref:histidine N-acetyltransferase-like n=1 Tax=Mytilus californianus TaxID=6549 RepID=UPI002245E4B7|nr:histidine N-acetyltransferase-like [Mytilus californianus]